MDPATEVAQLLEQSGARLVRNKKHLIWRLPNGLTFTQASTPSDRMAAAAQLRDLRHQLGMVDPERGQPGERRERKAANGRTDHAEIHSAGRVTGSFAEKLHAAGLAEDALKETIRRQADQLERIRHELALASAANHDKWTQIHWFIANRCWWCTAKARIRSVFCRMRNRHAWRVL